MHNTRRALLAGMLLTAITSCNDGSCYDNGSAVPLARFYSSENGSQVSISSMTVTAVGVPGDTLLIDSETVTDLRLPLTVNAEQVQWELTVATASDVTVTDTVSLTYRPMEYFAGVECGAMYYFDISHATTTHHLVDSVVIALARVTNVEQVNLRIYVPTN